VADDEGDLVLQKRTDALTASMRTGYVIGVRAGRTALTSDDHTWSRATGLPKCSRRRRCWSISSSRHLEEGSLVIDVFFNRVTMRACGEPLRAIYYVDALRVRVPSHFVLRAGITLGTEEA